MSFEMKDLYPKTVITSDGKRETFDKSKIARMLNKETGLDMKIAKEIADEVLKDLILRDKNVVSTKYIRDTACLKLTERNLHRHRNLFSRDFHTERIKFYLNDDFVEEYKRENENLTDLGYIVYKRTYARRIPEENRREEFWETLKRVVEGCYSIQKEHCKQLGLPWSEEKAQRSAQTMFKKIWNFKFCPPGRGFWMMGTEFVARRGSTSLNNCFEYNTKIITKDGIKKIGDCENTTQTLLTKNGKWIKAPIKSFGKQRLYKLTIKRNGIEKEIFCTRDHNWYAKSRRKPYRGRGFFKFKTTELPKNSRLAYTYARRKNSKINPFGIARGICYGDASTTPNKNCFLQLVGEKMNLKKYFPLNDKQDSSDYLCDKDSLRISQIPYHFKSLPSLNEGSGYLLGWLMGYFAADGSVSNGKVRISSSDKKDIEFVKDICSILGIGYNTVTKEVRDKKIGDYEYKEHTMYRLSLMPSTLNKEFFLRKKHRDNFDRNKRKYTWKVISVEETQRKEEVYCATVPQYHSFVLEDNIRTGNCGFVSTQDIDIKGTRPFEFLMDSLMLGVGVGFDTKGAGKIKIKEPQEEKIEFQVPDSREGWVEALKLILEAFFYGNPMPEYDYSLVRPAGEPIRGFGGVASGPEPLDELLMDIKDLLSKRVGEDITELDILDIMNMIGKCVVAGNVRRSAEIGLGNGIDFILAKNDEEKVKSHRWASNNTVIAHKGYNYSPVADQIRKRGEPGFFWIENARKYGRLKDEPNWKDKKAMGINPCGEQTLESFELCCLVETFPSHHDSYKEFQETLKYAYLYAKTVTLMNTHWKETNAVMLKNRRIGVSQTGITEAFEKHGRAEMFRWCDQGYEYLKDLDEIYSNWLCVPKSIKISTVKPSGTVSILGDVTSGIHYPHSKYYIRRVRIAENSFLVEELREKGYDLKKDVYSPKTLVVEFPIHKEYFGRSKSEVSMWEKAENAAKYQYYWSDNQVSTTITFNEEEAEQLEYLLQCYEDRLKSLTLMPIDDKTYEQAPYEEITKEEYEKRVEKIK